MCTEVVENDCAKILWDFQVQPDNHYGGGQTRKVGLQSKMCQSRMTINMRRKKEEDGEDVLSENNSVHIYMQ